MIVRLTVALGLCVASTGCRPTAAVPSNASAGRVRPGITVLVEDSIHVIRGKRIGLITNQSGIDEHGVSSIDVLTGERARAANVSLVRLFAPEHGIRGTEDRGNLSDEIDRKTGLPIVSLYTAGTIPPPDSTMRDIDALVVDLQDIGTRTWTFVGVMLYSMQATARLGKPIIVLDRPNPIRAGYISGPLLDTALANPNPTVPGGRAQKAYALYPVPLRHGLTMGEMARYFAREIVPAARLTVIPVAGLRRAMWFDQTGLPWVKPSPNMPDLVSALIYPSLVAFEGTNVSVGRGTPDAFQRFGAPWMDAPRIAAALEARRIPGVRFVVDSFTPRSPSDGKYAERRIPGIRIAVTDRDAVESGLLGASILWALSAAHRDSLRVTAATFDDRFGSADARVRLMRGEDPATVLALSRPAVDAYTRRMQGILIYR